MAETIHKILPFTWQADTLSRFFSIVWKGNFKDTNIILNMNGTSKDNLCIFFTDYILRYQNGNFMVALYLVCWINLELVLKLRVLLSRIGFS